MELSIFTLWLYPTGDHTGLQTKGGLYLTSCSRLLYSPSVFSLMIMMSMFLWRVWTPGSDWQCITLANKSKLVLVWKHRAETMAHVTTKTKHRLCQGFGDQFKTLTEGGYFWIWQKVASYVWFLCYLSWNNITVMASHLGSPFMISMKDRKKYLEYLWGRPSFGGWQWWRYWCRPHSPGQSWHVPPQSPQEHSWTCRKNTQTTHWTILTTWSQPLECCLKLIF